MSEDQNDQSSRKGIILLNPQWLSHIMSKVVALNVGTQDPGLDPVKLKLLDTKGIVAASLLKQIWRKHLELDHTFSLTHPLFTMLKMYGLLYPLSEKLHDVLLRSKWRSEDSEMMFLFPFKLPLRTKEVPFSKKGCGKFTVDFMSYLPDEVYSHLVIRFLESLDSQERRPENRIVLSHTVCKFMCAKISNVCADWLLEIDRISHTLTVSFK